MSTVVTWGANVNREETEQFKGGRYDEEDLDA